MKKCVLLTGGLEVSFSIFTSLRRILTLFQTADPYQAALVRAVGYGSTLLAYRNMRRYDPTLVGLTINFFVVCTNVKCIYMIIHIGWS